MKKIILTAIISLIFAYYSSIVFSLYNFHKAIFFKNENLIKKYINFKTLKINLKKNIENTIKSEIEKDKTLDPATKLLTYNLASNFSEILISNYINSKDITLLLNKTIKDEIPKPNLAKTYLDYERNNEKIPVIFKRDMFIWRLAGIKFNFDQIKRIIK